MVGNAVLITGASSGLGYEFVKLFAKENYEIIIVARTLERLDKIKDEFSNNKITVIKRDLTKYNAAKELYNEIKARGINIEILVNNAGFGLLGEFDKLNIENQKDMIELNITALTELTHFVVQEMKQRGRGKILNIASTAAFQPGPLMAVYYATKAYVVSFSEAVAQELKGTGITVTTLCPGATKTNFGKVAGAENANLFRWAMEADKVARIGFNGLMKGKRVVIAGAFNKIGAYSAKFLPRRITTKIAMWVGQQK